MEPIRLVTLAPGHFHAAFVQKRRLPGIDRTCTVFAPDDADLRLHLERIAVFHSDWVVDVRCGPDWVGQFEREPRGNVVVLSGRNRPKLDLMRRAISKGLHVLADKPWIIAPEDFEPLAELLREADRRGLVIADAMTERHEATNLGQRELILDPVVFGEWLKGSIDEPALEFESVHSLKKSVNNRPLLRPWWWFDSAISGDSMADVGTHLADLALWFVSPERVVDPHRDISMLDARSWPLTMTGNQVAAIMAEGAERLPETIEYAGNNSVSFTLRGIHVKLTTRWEYDSPGGDTHRCIARGTKATVEVHQQPGSQPELFLNDQYVPIPHAERTTHEEHFSKVIEEFVQKVRQPEDVPAWERANALAKYFITTRAGLPRP